MRFALISVAVNIVVGVTLVHFVGFQGIAAATAIAAWLNVAQMAVALGRKGHYLPSPQAWSRVIRITLASLVLAGLLAAAGHFRPQIEGLFSGFHFGRRLVGAKEAAILVTVLAGGALYPPLLLAFGGLRPSEIKAALRRQPKGPSLDEEIEQDLGKTPAGPDLL